MKRQLLLAQFLTALLASASVMGAAQAINAGIENLISPSGLNASLLDHPVAYVILMLAGLELVNWYFNHRLGYDLAHLLRSLGQDPNTQHHISDVWALGGLNAFLLFMVWLFLYMFEIQSGLFIAGAVYEVWRDPLKIRNFSTDKSALSSSDSPDSTRTVRQD